MWNVPYFRVNIYQYVNVTLFLAILFVVKIVIVILKTSVSIHTQNLYLIQQIQAFAWTYASHFQFSLCP
jgi:hypothetical protein